jgi:hypothetical protein
MVGGAHEVLRALGFLDKVDLAPEVAPRQRAGFARERSRKPGAVGEIGGVRNGSSYAADARV